MELNSATREYHMPTREKIVGVRKKLKAYLTETLLPFWVKNSPDPEYGGFLTHFDANGNPTGETPKTFLIQIRMLYTLSSAHRAGYGQDGRCAELAREGADFIIDHYWDEKYDGWCWIADRKGNVTCKDKVGYGQCFAIYAFSEYFLAIGDERGRATALRTYDAIARHMTDFHHGGFIELFHRDWTPLPPGRSGGDRKSLDIHMHMMEALTTLYEMTNAVTHRRHLIETIDLLLSRMLHPENGLGIAQFTYDFSPLPAINLDTTWGRDAEVPQEQVAKLIDQTSPGHNTELAWLLLHAADILKIPREEYAHVLRNMGDHCIEFGIDDKYGGVYADVPMSHPTQLTEKQFWQQGEVLIAMLDAYTLLNDTKYWAAFINVLDFIFNKFIAMDAGGEWYERLDREGNILDAALGHSWKISYHTVRSMIQVIKRLDILTNQSPQ